jgi:hypothetical protein
MTDRNTEPASAALLHDLREAAENAREEFQTIAATQFVSPTEEGHVKYVQTYAKWCEKLTAYVREVVLANSARSS